MKIAFYTLGCKANQFDTQALVNIALQRGHEIVDFTDIADCYVINSCSVTAESDRKSRQTVRSAKRRTPDSIIAVCGCFSQVSPDAAKALGADIVAGSRDRAELIGLIEKAYSERIQICTVSPYKPKLAFEVLPSGGYQGRTRALLKVEEGCDNYCTYCIIPYTRGHIRSLPLKDAAEEARKLAAAGYKEIVLTGIEISSYGHDLNDGTGLADLLETLCAAAPGVRMHLGSLEPRTVTEDFCARVSACGGVLPHFHLSMQSGCDDTLKRMRRKYDTERFYGSVVMLRKYFPNCGITTDLITGFPGETEYEFAQTLEFIKKCDFSQMHIFPYSVRPGTPAASMEQIPRAVKSARAHEAAKAAAQMHTDFMRAQIGRTLSVLFEEPDGDIQLGHSENYLPVRVSSDRSLRDSIMRVVIDSVDGEALSGHIDTNM